MLTCKERPRIRRGTFGTLQDQFKPDGWSAIQCLGLVVGPDQGVDPSAFRQHLGCRPCASVPSLHLSEADLAGGHSGDVINELAKDEGIVSKLDRRQPPLNSDLALVQIPGERLAATRIARANRR